MHVQDLYHKDVQIGAKEQIGKYFLHIVLFLDKWEFLIWSKLKQMCFLMFYNEKYFYEILGQTVTYTKSDF